MPGPKLPESYPDGSLPPQPPEPVVLLPSSASQLLRAAEAHLRGPASAETPGRGRTGAALTERTFKGTLQRRQTKLEVFVGGPRTRSTPSFKGSTPESRRKIDLGGGTERGNPTKLDPFQPVQMFAQIESTCRVFGIPMSRRPHPEKSSETKLLLLSDCNGSLHCMQAAPQNIPFGLSGFHRTIFLHIQMSAWAHDTCLVIRQTGKRT